MLKETNLNAKPKAASLPVPFPVFSVCTVYKFSQIQFTHHQNCGHIKSQPACKRVLSYKAEACEGWLDIAVPPSLSRNIKHGFSLFL